MKNSTSFQITSKKLGLNCGLAHSDLNALGPGDKNPFNYSRNKQAKAAGRLQRICPAGGREGRQGSAALHALWEGAALCPYPFRGCFACPAGKLPQGPAPTPLSQEGWIVELLRKPGTRLGLEGTYAGCHSNSANPCHRRPPYSENSDSKALLAPGRQPVIRLSGNRIASLSKINPVQSYEWKISKGHQSSWVIWHRLSIQQSQAMKVP